MHVRRFRVGAFHEADGVGRAAAVTPIEQLGEVFFTLAKVGLEDNADVAPVAELRLREHALEELEGQIVMFVGLHVDVDEGARLPSMRQQRA